MGKKKGNKPNAKNPNVPVFSQPSTSNNPLPPPKKKNKKKTKASTNESRVGMKDVMAAKVQNLVTPKPKYTVESLVEKAEKAYERFEYDVAAQHYKRALELQPENTSVIDMLAELLLDLEDEAQAKELLLKSVQLAPEEGYSKYMYLGQLSHSHEAMQYFRKGIEILKSIRAELLGPDDQEEDDTEDPDDDLEHHVLIGHTIGTALCSIAEIYMTDACFDEDAEQQCEKALLEAVVEDDDNIEVYQTMASFRLSQNNQVQGRESVMKVLELMAELPADQQPSYEFRMVTAKLLFELAEYEHAEKILDALAQESDEDVDVLYLLGLCCRHQNEFMAAYEHLRAAQDLATVSNEEGDMVQEIQKELELVRAQCNPTEIADFELEVANAMSQEEQNVVGTELDDIESDPEDGNDDMDSDDDA